MNSTNTAALLVLNDGETFTDVHGCSIVIVPIEQYEEIVRCGGDAKDFRPILEISLANVTPAQNASTEGGAR